MGNKYLEDRSFQDSKFKRFTCYAFKAHGKGNKGNV